MGGLGEFQTLTSKYQWNSPQDWPEGTSSFLERAMMEVKGGAESEEMDELILCHREVQVPQPSPLLIGKCSAWDCSGLSSSEGRPS